MIGIDEAGRGSLIGPVFACALFFPEGLNLGFEVKDSKTISQAKRLQIYENLKNHNEVKFAVSTASVEEIENLNILNATLLAMERAFLKLNLSGKVLIDGNKKPKTMPFAECIVGGDAKIAQISAASIIAKVERDFEMVRIHKIIPEYDILNNKGYGTQKHYDAVQKHGLSNFHRKTFKFER